MGAKIIEEVALGSYGFLRWCKVLRRTRRRVLLEIYYPSNHRTYVRWYSVDRILAERRSEGAAPAQSRERE